VLFPNYFGRTCLDGGTYGRIMNEPSTQTILLGLLSRNDRRQVVHTHVPLLPPSSINWYREKGYVVLRLGR